MPYTTMAFGYIISLEKTYKGSNLNKQKTTKRKSINGNTSEYKKTYKKI
jgi:hypothetical protein